MSVDGSIPDTMLRHYVWHCVRNAVAIDADASGASHEKSCESVPKSELPRILPLFCTLVYLDLALIPHFA